VFVSGREFGTPTRVGPGYAGLIVITPSIPDIDGGSVCAWTRQVTIAVNASVLAAIRNSIALCLPLTASAALAEPEP